jgi:hypothetical protein
MDEAAAIGSLEQRMIRSYSSDSQALCKLTSASQTPELHRTPELKFRALLTKGDAESARDVIKFHREYLDPFRAASVTLLIVDHQGKTQAGERYQNKRTFGSVYKENLARSVLQVAPGERGEGLLTLKLRQTKHNFGSKAEPFGVRVTFSEENITVDDQPLDATELAEESILNARDRVLAALKDGPAYPADIAETCIMPLGTVKNELTRLRKRGLVEYAGEVEPHTKAKEVRLTDLGAGVTDPIEDCDAVIPNGGSPRASVYARPRAP